MTQMVTGQEAVVPFDDDGAALRFPTSDPAPPPFGTAPLGYRRSEVDAWAVWVGKLVAHGRRETVRADSAEATLRATLKRLDQLERLDDLGRSERPERPEPGSRPLSERPRPRAVPDPDAAPGDAVPCHPAPDHPAPDHPAPGHTAPGDTTPGHAVPGDTTPGDTASGNAASGDATPGHPARSDTGPDHPRPATGLPRRTPGAAGMPRPVVADDAPGTTGHAGTAGGTDGTDDARGTRGADTGSTTGAAPQRLQVVESTLHEVMSLLHVLVERDGPRPG